MLRFIALPALLLSLNLGAQPTSSGRSADSVQLARFFNAALTQGKTYSWLEYLSTRIGGRLAGSPQAAAAVEWSRQVMDTLGFDRVFLQEVMVPHWVRGEKEICRAVTGTGQYDLNILALGNAVGTGSEGLLADVVEVKSLAEVAALGRKGVAGKIVFYNRPMNPAHISTFEAYGEAGDQRRQGPSEAAKYGAVGVLVRSLTTALDDNPHTGSLRYAADLPKIPAAAISTLGAEQLSGLLKREPKLKLYFRQTCVMLSDVKSYNVVGEIRGSTFPDEIVAVGGHLDAWDNGMGAHDDGAGCVQSIEALRLFKVLGIRPKRTLRAVLFMNEENGVRGGNKYAELAKTNGEKHLAAIESDRGGFTPRGFNVEGNVPKIDKLLAWKPLLEPYGLGALQAGETGTDIEPLKAQGVTLFELIPDPQRYFEYHHTGIDTFDKVNRRELELGAAALASLVYLLSEHGL